MSSAANRFISEASPDYGEPPPPYRLMSVNSSFTVRSVYLKPREMTPYPGTVYIPSYDFNINPEFPLPLTEITPLFVDGSAQGPATFIAEASGDHTKIQYKIPPPNDVAHFETVASEPPLCEYPGETQEKKVLLPKPVSRQFVHSEDGLSDKPDKVAEHILNVLGGEEKNPPPPSVSDSSQQTLEEQQQLAFPSSSYYASNLHTYSETDFYGPSSLRERQMTTTIMQSNAYFLKQPPYPSAIMNRPFNTNRVVPSPTSSSLGLTQMKALYEEMTRKRSKGGKKKSSSAQPVIRRQPQPAKKARTIFSDTQCADMLRVFRQTPYISAKDRYALAQRLEIPEETISVWFKNQRSKLKKKMYPLPTPVSTPTTSFNS